MPLRKYRASIEFFGMAQVPVETGLQVRQRLFSRTIALSGVFANASNALRAAVQKVGAPPSGCDEIKLTIEEVQP